MASSVSARAVPATGPRAAVGAASRPPWRRPSDQPSASAPTQSGTATRSSSRTSAERLTAASAGGLDQEERLAVLDAVPVLAEDPDDAAGNLRLDLVHELHRLDDAQDLAFLHDVALVHVRLGVRGRRAIERADHRGLDRDAAHRLDVGHDE